MHLIIDTETTGLSPYLNKTLTVGLLLANTKPKKLQILDQAHIFVKHDNYNAQKTAMLINKINLESHNKHAIHPTRACKQINQFIERNSLYKTPIVGHNIHFDKGFLKALSTQGQTPLQLNEDTIDTIKIWKDLQRKELIPPQPKSTLSHLASHFQIDYTKAHDALADCYITAQVYHKMLKLQEK